MKHMELLRMIWWLVLVRGIALLFFGILAVAWPGITLVVLSYIFAFYILWTGVVNIVHGTVSVAHRRAWFLSLILGLLQIGVSIYVLSNPLLTLATFILLAGFTFFLQGVLEIAVAFMDKDTGSKVLDTIGGVLGIIAGLFVLRYPIAGGLAFTWIMGVYGIFVGALVIAAALNIHTLFEEALQGKGKGRLAM